jgi:prevent-host-death family protein
MSTFNIHEAKTHFSKIINKALSGEEVIIARGDKPVVKLIPYKQEKSFRKGGQLKGMIKISSNFDDPLPKDSFGKFYGEDE